MIIYFSATGNTKAVADALNKESNFPIYEIKAQQPYSEDDLNWHNNNSRANREQNDHSARPKIAGELPDLSQVSHLYLGFPLWWGQAPRILESFLDEANLEGKTVYTFCTSGSSPIGPALEELKKNYPRIQWSDGKRFSQDNISQEVRTWISSHK